jgi:hypothetical protein
VWFSFADIPYFLFLMCQISIKKVVIQPAGTACVEDVRALHNSLIRHSGENRNPGSA